MSVKTQSGGMFNSYKITYSPETHKLLKVLMDEVKLTTSQRQQMRGCLKKGEPLPVVTRRCHRPSYVDENLFDLKRNYYFQRRGRDQIVHSGAYEREKYRFLDRTVDLEKEKEKLQNLMVYGKKGKAPEGEEPAKKAKEKTEALVTVEERVAQLQVEIDERLEFLNDMAEMGKEKEYEVSIRQEIWAKLREMERLDKNLSRKYKKLLLPERKPDTEVLPLKGCR